MVTGQLRLVTSIFVDLAMHPWFSFRFTGLKSLLLKKPESVLMGAFQVVHW